MIGSILFSVANIYYMIGSFIADFNETHIYNPRWSSHAKFHDGQTMTLSVLLGATSLYLFFRRGSSRKEKQHDLFNAAVVGSLYCLSGLVAISFPGTAWADPDHKLPITYIQAYLFSLQLVLNWLGYFLELRGLNAIKAQ